MTPHGAIVVISPEIPYEVKRREKEWALILILAILSVAVPTAINVKAQRMEAICLAAKIQVEAQKQIFQEAKEWANGYGR